LLTLIPYVGLVVPFVLGAKGSQWAWRKKRWDSVEDFRRVQRKWAYWGAGVWAFILVVGIGGAIAIPKFTETRERAYVSAMETDLRNLTIAEEAYFADHSTYSDDLEDLDLDASAGVTITIREVTPQGWRATAQHSGTETLCELYIGGDIEPMFAQREGWISCR
jgi:hypothetical protein